MGKLLAICTSPKRGTVKTEVPSAVLTPEWGIISDAHGGSWHRQVSLLSAEKIEAFRKKIWVDYGAFGENLVIEGFDFRNLPVTSRFAIGSVVLQGAVNGLGSSIVAAQTAGGKAAQFLSVPLESIGTAMTEYIQTMKLMGDQSAAVFSRFAIAEKDRFLHKLDNFRIDHIWMNVLI